MANQPVQITPDMPGPLLSVRGLSKRFDHVVALDDVSFDAYSHEVIGLVGDNGAGKSTLLKILSGVYKPNKGKIHFDNNTVSFDSPIDSRSLGIEVIYQDMALVDELTVWENIFLGRLLRLRIGLIDRRRMMSESVRLLDSLGLTNLSPEAKVGYLSGGQKKAVAISRAIYWDARVIFMDEPTAALAVVEIGRVLDLIKTLKDAGAMVIFVSHNLQEVLSTVDRVLVLHRGHLTGIRSVKETNEQEIVGLMMGRE